MRIKRGRQKNNNNSSSSSNNKTKYVKGIVCREPDICYFSMHTIQQITEVNVLKIQFT
jgi:hypothetical protein